MSDADDPIDREVLARLDFGDPPGEVLAMLVGTFLEHAPANLAAMVDGAGRGDADAVRLASHSLKSSARQFGAMRREDARDAPCDRVIVGDPHDQTALAAHQSACHGHAPSDLGAWV